MRIYRSDVQAVEVYVKAEYFPASSVRTFGHVDWFRLTPEEWKLLDNPKIGFIDI